jgi:hypothetical protein
MPEVQLYDLLVAIAKTDDEFELAIAGCLKTNGSDRAARVTAMAQETWEAKLDAITAVL